LSEHNQNGKTFPKSATCFQTGTEAELAYKHAAQICRDVAKEFLAPEYATNQPLSSFSERFACGQCAEAIEGALAALHPHKPA
jgi:hypothetical protein